MLMSLLRSGNLRLSLVYLIVEIPVILFSLILHEMAHAYVADKLGDFTGRATGRLSFSPKNHLDPIGTVCLLLFGFGWAKPVMVNTRNFKHPKRDMAFTAFAGPVTNLILGFIGCFFMCLVFKLNVASVSTIEDSNFTGNLISIVYLFFEITFSLNIYLAIFNLIPVPPLDGSRLLYAFLPDKYYFGLMKYERYIALAIMVLLFTGVLSVPLNFICSHVMDGYTWLCLRILGL